MALDSLGGSSRDSVGLGKFGFVTLCGPSGIRCETECFVVPQEGQHSVIVTLTMESRLLSETDWFDVQTAGHSGHDAGERPPWLTDDGIPTGLPLRKVESQAIKGLPTNNETMKRWDPRLEQGILRKAYYKSSIAESGSAAIAATSTDDGSRGRRRWGSENRRRTYCC